MAIKDKDWNIVSTKQLNKKVTKTILQKSVVWKEVYWLEWPRRDLWVGTILEEIKDKVKIDCLNRCIKVNPNQNRETRVVDKSILTFEKK